jgi:hypothetical protein
MSSLKGIAAHRAQERINLEWVREHLQSAAVDLKAFRRDGDFST